MIHTILDTEKITAACFEQLLPDDAVTLGIDDPVPADAAPIASNPAGSGYSYRADRSLPRSPRLEVRTRTDDTWRRRYLASRRHPVGIGSARSRSVPFSDTTKPPLVCWR